MLLPRRAILAGAALLASPARAEAYRWEKLPNGNLVLRLGARTVLRYNLAQQTPPRGQSPLLSRSGYLHPVYAPAGRLVTDDFAPDHPHQRGVFFAWTRTRLELDGKVLEPDFWNLAAGSGRIRAEKAGIEENRLAATHSWEARAGDGWRPVLSETWRVWPGAPPADPPLPGSAYVIEIESIQRPLVDITLPQYRYGGMGVRASREWMSRGDLKVLTSEGFDIDRAEGERCRWFALGGVVDQVPVTVAMLEHPANLGAPNPIRLGPAAPYAMFSPPKSREWLLRRDVEHRFRFRLVVHNGLPDAGFLNRLWSELASARE